MDPARQALLRYVEFLGECGNLYLESRPIPEAPATSTFIGQTQAAASKAELPAKSPGRPTAPNPAPRPSRTPASAPGTQTDFLQTPAEEPALGGRELDEPERRRRAEDAMKAVADCRRCVLCRERTQTVYGDGSLMARIVFVGEAPGVEEDRTGVPFVGRAGQLLTRMIEAIGFKRSQVYICNTIKCRPPGNRDPLPGEKKACEPFLIEQLELIRPQIIVALGSHAGAYLTGLETSIGKLRRRWHRWRGIPVMVTYHPAFLLRSPGFKTQAWEDLLMLSAKYAELNPDDKRSVWGRGGLGS